MKFAVLIWFVFLLAPTHAGGGKRRRKRLRLRKQVGANICCAARNGQCNRPTCCHLASDLEAGSSGSSASDSVAVSAAVSAAVDSCAPLPTRRLCESSFPSFTVPGRDVCVWVGGQCTSGSEADCADPWHAVKCDCCITRPACHLAAQPLPSGLTTCAPTLSAGMMSSRALRSTVAAQPVWGLLPLSQRTLQLTRRPPESESMRRVKSSGEYG